jgi:hypothetical protein
MGEDHNVMVDEHGEEVGGGMPTMEEMMREAMAADEDEEELEDEGLEGEELEDVEVEQLLDDEEAPEPDPSE